MWIKKKLKMKRPNKKDFIRKSIEIHGSEKYDYSLVEYKKSSIKVKIICKDHGVFEQTPNNHLSGVDCKSCAYIMNGENSRSSTEKFINKSMEIHGEIYDYSLVEYIGNKIMVKIVCKNHGIFEQRPNDHLSGRMCFMCFGTKKRTNEEFISEANDVHNKKYDYSLVEYVNTNIKVKIICRDHGIFEKSPSGHLYSKNGGGCQKCKPNFKLNTDTFISKSRKFHKDRYDYSKSIFINSHTEVIITCKKHGDFSQKPYKHIQKRGCPKCRNSQGITKICNLLNQTKIDYDTEKTIEGCVSSKGNRLYFDIYIPEIKIYIEYDGEQHYRPVKSWGGEKSFIELKERDSIKDKFCLDNNIKLLRISYKDNIEDMMRGLLTW